METRADKRLHGAVRWAYRVGEVVPRAQEFFPHLLEV